MRSDRIGASAGYAAATLILLHAVLSAYWAAGGTALLTLLSDGIREQADLRETWFVGMVWGVAVAKLIAGLVVIAVAKNWYGPFPRWLLRLFVWGTGVVLALYGSFNIIVGLAALSGLLNGPETRGPEFWAYLLLWAPLWLAIGISYLLTARYTSRWY